MNHQDKLELAAQVKNIKRIEMARDAASLKQKQAYELGNAAALRGESVDSMPRYKNANNVASWLKGHADGVDSLLLKNAVNKIGLLQIKQLVGQPTKTLSPEEALAEAKKLQRFSFQKNT